MEQLRTDATQSSRITLKYKQPFAWPSYFTQICFALSRGAQRVASVSRAPGALTRFLAIKKQTGGGGGANQTHTEYYVLSVDASGHLTLDKIRHLLDVSLVQRDILDWSLRHAQFSLNEEPERATKVCIKLSARLVELSVNEAFVSRFELVGPRDDDRGDDDLVEPPAFAVERIEFINQGEVSFAVRELTINELLYNFVPASANAIRPLALHVLNERHIVLDKRQFEIEHQANAYAFAASLGDEQLVDSLNGDERFCESPQRKKHAKL